MLRDERVDVSDELPALPNAPENLRQVAPSDPAFGAPVICCDPSKGESCLKCRLAGVLFGSYHHGTSVTGPLGDVASIQRCLVRTQESLVYRYNLGRPKGTGRDVVRRKAPKDEKAPKPPNEGFAERLTAAREARKDLTLQEIAAGVSQLLGRDPPYTYQAVQNWLKGHEPESFAVVEALGVVLRIDPGFLAFGTPIESPATPMGVPRAEERTG